jgi:serine O-acetyltransferase
MQEKLNFPYLGTALVHSIRAYNRYKRRDGILAKLLCKYWSFRHFLLSVVTQSDIGVGTTFGERVLLPHPNGVVIHGNSTIGNDCMIMQQVTVGQLATPDAPIVGSGVYIGAGAKILGKIAIGDRARIGANAVVLCDVPAGWTAVGVPARLIPPKPVQRAETKSAEELEQSQA